jgi:HK97 family phage portal protein
LRAALIGADAGTVRFSLRREAQETRPAPAIVGRTLVRPGALLEEAIVNWTPAAAGRDAALTIPSILACRNLIVGAAVQMGIYSYRGTERLASSPLLTQPDPDTTWPATLAGTLDDLLFYGRAYWRVLAFDGAGSEIHPQGFPIRARWIPYTDVQPKVEPATGAYSRLDGYNLAGEPGLVSPDEMIRFDSPLPGVLVLGARTISAAIAIEDAARRFADVELPAGVLVAESDDLSDEELAEKAQGFMQARASNAIAALRGFTYERVDISANDLQLVEARALASTECARLFNVPVAMISASPSGNASMLQYQSLPQQLAVFVSNAVAPHLETVEATLSLPAVTPRGQSVAFDVQAFLRSDPQAAADYALQLYAADVITRDEARSFLGIPSTSATSDLTPGRV